MSFIQKMPFTKISCAKFVCVAAVAVGVLAASSAFAQCTKSQEVALATQATREVVNRLRESTTDNVMRIRDCAVDDSGVVRADFVFNYVNDQGVQTVSGTVESNGDRVTSLSFSGKDRRVALEDSYSETSYGAYRY